MRIISAAEADGGGMTATGEPALTIPLPDTFTLADLNPISGLSYRHSSYLDLPPYAVAVIGVTRDAWDRMVRSGTVALALDVQQVHSLVVMLADLKARQRLVWDGYLDIGEDIGDLCPECLGTSIAHDFDASITGVQDAPHLCFCASARRSRHLHFVADDARVAA